LGNTDLVDRALIDSTEAMIRARLSGEGTGHDWRHIDRVRTNALRIGREEGAHLEIVELGALLHDVADHKFHNGDDTIGPQIAKEWLESLHAPEWVCDAVVEIVRSVSFKGADVADTSTSLEAKVVQDADRLDAMGAIGIARAFAYGGYKGRELYNPEIPPVRHSTFDDYKKTTSPTINHFYEKLLLLLDRMHTASGRRLAEQRHRYMEEFLKQFYAEWNGEI